MKKIILALLTTCSVAAANAQMNSILLYGDFGINRTSSDAGSSLGTTTRTTGVVMPGIGYQFTRHVTLGIQGGYEGRQNDYPSSSNMSSNLTSAWTVGMFLRYTENINHTFAFFGQFNAGYMGMQERTDNVGSNTSTVTLNGFRATITPAVRINIYRNFALNFNFGGFDMAVLTGNNNMGGTRTIDNFEFTLGRQMNIGISKNFGCCIHRHHSDDEHGMETRRMKTSDDDDDIPMPKKAKKVSKKAAEADLD
jgi:hypothetical protein